MMTYLAHWFVALTALGFLVDGRAFAADPMLTLDVWPGKVPGETGQIAAEGSKTQPGPGGNITIISNVSKPTLAVYKPTKEKDTGAAVVICPGGGYSILAYDLEGTEVADWLNSIGVTGIVLKYRVPARPNLPRWEPPLQDAQRAISLVRSKATEWGIDPKRIGLLGFSAGGNLTAVASTHFDKRAYEAIDDADKLSCRPDFGVLIYPAWLENGDSVVPEVPVTAQTPPMFLAHANDDPINAESSVMMYLALKRAKVPAELHLFAKGGHGFGLRKSDHPCSEWPQRCEEWMKSQGLLKSSDAKH